MLTACLDESGTFNDSNSFCVCGVLYDRKGIKHFDRIWKKELEYAGIRYFHTSECVGLRGQFEGKEREFTNGVYERLIAVMNKYACGTVSVCSIPRGEFNFNREDWRYSSYTVCTCLCINFMSALADRLGYGKEITCFVEDGHPKRGELLDLLRRKSKAGWKGIYQLTDKFGFRGVQSADILAYETRKRIEELLKTPEKSPDRKLRMSLNAILTNLGSKNTQIITVLNEQVRQKFLDSLPG